MYYPFSAQRLPHQDFQKNLKVGLLLEKPDFQAMEGKSLTEVAHHADKVANGVAKEKLHAHDIFSPILEQLPASEHEGLTILTGKLSKSWGVAQTIAVFSASSDTSRPQKHRRCSVST